MIYFISIVLYSSNLITIICWLYMCKNYFIVGSYMDNVWSVRGSHSHTGSSGIVKMLNLSPCMHLVSIACMNSPVQDTPMHFDIGSWLLTVHENCPLNLYLGTARIVLLVLTGTGSFFSLRHLDVCLNEIPEFINSHTPLRHEGLRHRKPTKCLSPKRHV